MQQSEAGQVKMPQGRAYYAALVSRDVRFDGRFFAGVTTTGVYCRPVCPARKPNFEHCRFFRSAAEAQADGFRPCKRCRPETAPSSAAWMGTEATVRRALRLIESGAMDEAGVDQLAARLGVTARHLRRLFSQHLGVSPQKYAATHRLNVASQLLLRSQSPITEIAIAAGFGSSRRFNSAFRDVYGVCPSTVRRANRSGRDASTTPPLRLELSFAQPYDWDGLLGNLRKRAIDRLERVDDRSYTRSFRAGGEHGVISIRRHRGKPCLIAEIRLSSGASILSVIERTKALFDLDAVPERVADTLTQDPRLNSCFDPRVGIRVAGGWELFELGVRAILGQQVTIAAGRTLGGRLVEEFGEPNQIPEAQAFGCGRQFPTAEALADSEVERIGLPNQRANAVRDLARFYADLSDPKALTDDEMADAILRLPGIGRWTVDYIRLRGFKDPDALPFGDVALLNAAKSLGIASTARELHDAAEAWRPWRSYATLALWSAAGKKPTTRSKANGSVKQTTC